VADILREAQTFTFDNLRVNKMQSDRTLTLPAGQRSLAVPDDLLSVLRMETTLYQQVITPRDLNSLKCRRARNSDGAPVQSATPLIYSRTTDSFEFDLAPDSALTIELIAYFRPAFLGDGTGGTAATNILTTTYSVTPGQSPFSKLYFYVKILTQSRGSTAGMITLLNRLEAEAIHIIREVVATFSNPVMLYSIGKDSSVMLHLAMKAFYPAKPPFPFLHVDTTWKFKDMIQFRDRTAAELGIDLLIHVNEEGVAENINPFTHGSNMHTHVMKTVALRQALDKYGFDAAFGGARRDEEKSRAKERIFSFRNAQQAWDPKNQRPEMWKTYNTRIHKGESIRVFPLSNWTELDIWQYILKEQIPIVPLYFAALRPVVERDGMLIMVDDARMPLRDGEIAEERLIRFRTLGCYPLTGATVSDAADLQALIREMLITRTSERQGRMIDKDESGSMEKKKREGYF